MDTIQAVDQKVGFRQTFICKEGERLLVALASLAWSRAECQWMFAEPEVSDGPATWVEDGKGEGGWP